MTINARSIIKPNTPQKENTDTEVTFKKRMNVIGKQFFNLNGLNATSEEKKS